MQGASPPLLKLAVQVRRGLWCAAFVSLGASSRSAAQTDTTMGPPPHFTAAWAPPGTLLDVSHMGSLRHRVSLDLTNVPIDTALAIIRERADLKLLYRADVLPTGRRVSIQATGITAASALAEVLLDTRIDVVMIQSGNLV